MLAFVHIEKTAGMSVQQVLKRSFGMRFCAIDRWRLSDDRFTARDLRELRLLYPRLDAISGHWIKPYADLDQACPDLRYWTLLREPLVRCASHFQHQQRMGWVSSFERWIDDDHYRNFQTKKLVGCEDVEAAIRLLEDRFLFVGLSERFDESMLLLQRLVGGKQLDITYTAQNVARDPSTSQKLLRDTKTRKQLEEANRADQQLYAYVRDQLYPRQVAEFGPDLAEALAQARESNRPTLFDLNRRASDLKRYALYKPAVYLSRWLRS